MRNSWKRYIFIFVCCIFLLPCKVKAQGIFEVKTNCTANQNVEIVLTTSGETRIDGFDIYRAESEMGEYQYIGTKEIMEDEWDNIFYYNYYIRGNSYEYIYTDVTTLNANQNYFYRVEAYRYEENVKTILQTSEVAVYIKSAAPVITYGKRTGKSAAKIKWSQDVNADGYLIYYVRNYDDESKLKSVNIYDESVYELLETITTNGTTSKKYTKLMNGVTYTYRISSYKMIDGQMVTSVMSEPKSVTMDYYSYDGESYSKRIKRAFGSEKKKKKNFKTAAKAAKQMKTIKIKVWDFANGKKGKKITKIKYLTVNKHLAPSIKAMFDEIYKCDEKQVIHDIGCFSYRTGEHMYGMAIDINANENYMIDGGTVLAGSFWNPKKSKYSIPLKCETVRIMARYGFYRGFWGDRKDYMHFSYFGT